MKKCIYLWLSLFSVVGVFVLSTCYLEGDIEARIEKVRAEDFARREKEWELTAQKIGDVGPGGGTIFYRSFAGFTMTDNNEMCHYLEAAPYDHEYADVFRWASSGYTNRTIEGTSGDIGAGRRNTARILSVDANAPAAKACRGYSNNGKTDWFLPNTAELAELYKYNGPGTYSCWASLEGTGGEAYYVMFGDKGAIYKGRKDYLIDIWPIRAF